MVDHGPRAEAPATDAGGPIVLPCEGQVIGVDARDKDVDVGDIALADPLLPAIPVPHAGDAL